MNIFMFLSLLAVPAIAQRSQPPTAETPVVVQPVLTAAASAPFKLRAVITEHADPSEHVEVEMLWAAPDKWRRTIRSTDFSQTLIVNGDKSSEQDSDDYIPLGIQTLVTAMVDPRPVLQASKPTDLVITKANGKADESGNVCFGKMCIRSRYGLTEEINADGRSVTFMDYRPFHSLRVARRLTYKIDPGDNLESDVKELTDLKNPDESLFAISAPTPARKQIHVVRLSDTELRALALQSLDVIWPQVLDGATTGQTSYYVSIDRDGKVREVLPISVAIERADESARRQIMQWRFKPVEGAQIEGPLHFTFNTRAYGPAEPFTDAEARKLATNIVEPRFPTGVPSGATCNLRVAVDFEGKTFEVIPGECPHDLYSASMKALGQWHFAPYMENGQPRPYRALITFRAR